MRLVGMAALAPIAFVLVLPILLLGQEVRAPSWVRERVEDAAESALGGGTLRFSAITVRLARDLRPRVRLLDAVLRDADGRQLARVPEVTATLSSRGLVRDRVARVVAMTLTGAEVSLSRARDGRVDVVLDAGEAGGPPGGLAARLSGLASLPEAFERLFDRPSLAALRSVRVDGLVVNYDDARAGRTWTLDGGRLALDVTRDAVRLAGEVSVLSGRDYATRATLRYESPRSGPAARISLTLTDVAAADVASQGPALAWLDVLDAPISAALRVEVDEAGALGPLHVALKSAGGELRPVPGGPAVGLDLVRAYLSFDPAAQAIDFDTVEVRSDWGGALASGRAYLRDVTDGMPGALVGQFAITDATVAPPAALDAPLQVPAATLQARLRLDPFVVEIAEAGLDLAGQARIGVDGRIAATPEGWDVALDAEAEAIARDALLALWPPTLRPPLRGWVSANVVGGSFQEPTASFRRPPAGPSTLHVGTGFVDARVRPLATHPPIQGAEGRLTYAGGDLVVALDRGSVAAPAGGRLDVAGTSVAIRTDGPAAPWAEVGLQAAGPIAASLSLLDLAPYRLISAAGQPTDLAAGSIEARGTIDLPLGRPIAAGELGYDIAATMREVRAPDLVPGHPLAADAIEARVTPAGIEIGGPMRVGGAAATGTWSQAFGPEGQGRSVVQAIVEVSPATLAEFGIVLPDGAVRGEGTGDLTIDLVRDESPRFAFRSDLAGVALALPEVGWSKTASDAADLAVEGRLGSPPEVERIALEAPGLSAEGRLTLDADGSLDRLSLSRLRVGDWLDASVALVGRGSGATPGVEVAGGSLDLRRAAFGGGGGGEGGPVSVALDRLQVTDGIALTAVTAEIGTALGVEGTFSGQVNGGPVVTGRLAPQGDRVGARVQGEDAGAVLRAAGLFSRAIGGSLDLLFLPVGEESYEGEAWIAGITVREAPVLASLLNAVSVVGLLQQLGGLGLRFEEVSAEFRIDPEAIAVTRSSAVGVGLGLSLDGTYDTTVGRMDFQGVLSPFYLINGVGSVLTRPGEGLVGFNFTLRGDPAAPQVGVNPLSALAPGMFRNLFRRPPPVVGQ